MTMGTHRGCFPYKPGHLIELKYVPILKIYRALDKNDSFLIVFFTYLSTCPFKKIWKKISPEG